MDIECARSRPSLLSDVLLDKVSEDIERRSSKVSAPLHDGPCQSGKLYSGMESISMLSVSLVVREMHIKWTNLHKVWIKSSYSQWIIRSDWFSYLVGLQIIFLPPFAWQFLDGATLRLHMHNNTRDRKLRAGHTPDIFLSFLIALLSGQSVQGHISFWQTPCICACRWFLFHAGNKERDATVLISISRRRGDTRKVTKKWVLGWARAGSFDNKLTWFLWLLERFYCWVDFKISICCD